MRASQALASRVPWALPLSSFCFGALSFFLVQRSESLARYIALIALAGWPWLLAEAWLGRWAVHRSGGALSIATVRFVTQQIQQEILFFALPMLVGATVLAPGQLLFVGATALIATLICIDPIYQRWICPHAGISSALHAFCTFIAALVVLPVVLHLPLEKAFPLATGITAISLLASLPRMLSTASDMRWKLIGISALPASLALLWAAQSWVPPAGFWVQGARISDHIDGLEPGAEITHIRVDDLKAHGALAYVAVRAPLGLEQAVRFDWHHRQRRVDRIAAQIEGGVDTGFRTFSRKLNFPQDPTGDWRVDLRTPQGQLIARMRFEVGD